MILDELKALRVRLEKQKETDSDLVEKLPPDHHKRQSIQWILDINADGTFGGWIKKDKKKDPLDKFIPTSGRTGKKPPPHLIADKAEYVLGVAQDKKTPNEQGKAVQDAANKFVAFKSLVIECQQKVNLASLDAFVCFLEQNLDTAKSALIEQKGSAGDIVLPRVNGKILTDLSEIQQFWMDKRNVELVEKCTLEGECLLCGEEKPIVPTHPVIFNVGGSSGVGVVSANSNAFESYGLSNSEIAPMCLDCARQYGEAIRYLLGEKKHKFQTGEVVYLYWTKKPTDFDFFNFLQEPDENAVRELLKSPFSSQQFQVDDTAFYALGVSTMKVRLIIRSWLNSTISEVKRHLAQYFESQQIGDSSPQKLYSLAASLVRDANKDLPPQVVPALLEFALYGKPIPYWLLQLAVARARADKDNTMPRNRAALIKMILISQNPNLNLMSHLQDRSEAAYQCGRLLALLDAVQRNAISPKATLTDRYYGAASTTPASVFGALLRNAQNHLAKLRKTKMGLYVFFEKEITAIMAQLDAENGFPRTLTLQDQGLFAIGFYHQKNHKQSKMENETHKETPSEEEAKMVEGEQQKLF